MKAKQIAITLEQTRETQNVQHFDGSPTTETVETGLYYEVIKMRNAVVLDLGSRGSNNLRFVRVGDRLNEKQAEELARIKIFDVTITK